MKKIVITKPGCRLFANHVWNYISIYAYALETGAQVINPSFSTWHRYFNLQRGGLFSLFGRLRGVIDVLYGSYVVRMHKSCSLLAVNELIYLSPPTAKKACDTLYCIGCFFRNPRGLERYRTEIITAFMPKQFVLERIKTALAPLRGKHLIGVELRQRPYPGFPKGDFLVRPERIRHIVEEYLREKRMRTDDVALVIVSDAPVDSTVFHGFKTHFGNENEVTALFLLSKCGVVIGTNATFSNLAAWFGNVPHLVATNEPIDWAYYKDQATYFENKYATFAH